MDKNYSSLIKFTNKGSIFKVVFFTTVGAISEMFSIAFLVIILSLFNKNKLDEILNNYEILNFLQDYNHFKIMYFILIVFVFVQIIKSLVIIFMNYVQANFIYDLRTNISSNLLKKYLYLDLHNHHKNNSSKYIRNIIIESHLACTGFMLPLVIIFTEILVFFLILILIFNSEPYISFMILAFLVFFYFSYSIIFRNKLIIWGKKRQDFENNRIKFAKESVGLFKVINLLNLQNSFYKGFLKINNQLAKIEKIQLVISPLPRLAIEFSALVTITLLILIFSQSTNDISNILPKLGLILASGLRLLPSFNRILTSFQKIRYNKPVIALLKDELHEVELKEEKIKNKKVSFSKKLEITNLNYRLENKNYDLLSINKLTINKNDKIGIFGKSGSGKSTLLDIIMGFIKPNNGIIKIDNKFDLGDENNLFLWKKKIGYLPQKMILLDDTILTNITLNINNNIKIDRKYLSKVLKVCCLDTFIKDLDKGIDTLVGENGSKLSGGEIQRICLARCLYTNPEVIIIDEGTSALDKDTELKLIKNLFSLKKTIIFVSHKKSSLKYCNKIYKIINKNLIKQKKSYF